MIVVLQGRTISNTTEQEITVFANATELESAPTLVAEANEDDALPEPVTT